MACRILVPQPGTESVHCTVEAQSLNTWTARKVLYTYLLISINYPF